jgi:hypothetical protein
VKSSKEIIQSLSNLYLKGEGDLNKKLNSLGCGVSYSQNLAEEAAYQVMSGTQDLLSGIAICKVAAALSQHWDIVEVYNHELVPPLLMFYN